MSRANAAAIVLRQVVRTVVHKTFAMFGYIYDFYRFVRYSGVQVRSDTRSHEYKVIKTYHRLEKSLSFRNRNKTSGWSAASLLVDILEGGRRRHLDVGFHSENAIKVLSDFVNESDTDGPEQSRVRSFVASTSMSDDAAGGVKVMSDRSIKRGSLSFPEDFFFSRHSVRDYASEPVADNLLKRALSLSLSTPSACNRQPWHVYHYVEREAIDQVLAHQNGNRGFGHEVPCLLIVAVDIAAFDTAGERNQHWIDGGMFVMSLTLALHSLGLSTCCLNWSKGPADDLRLRRSLNIRDNHSIVSMMAVGYPRKQIKVCASPRRPLDEIYTKA